MPGHPCSVAASGINQRSSGRITRTTPADPSVAFLGHRLKIEDEIYQIRDFDARGSKILKFFKKKIFLGGPEVHPQPYGWPLAWTRSTVAAGHAENTPDHRLMRNATQ